MCSFLPSVFAYRMISFSWESPRSQIPPAPNKHFKLLVPTYIHKHVKYSVKLQNISIESRCHLRINLNKDNQTQGKNMKRVQIGYAKDKDICDSQSKYLLDDITQIIFCNKVWPHIHIWTTTSLYWGSLCPEFRSYWLWSKKSVMTHCIKDF